MQHTHTDLLQPLQSEATAGAQGAFPLRELTAATIWKQGEKLI